MNRIRNILGILGQSRPHQASSAGIGINHLSQRSMATDIPDEVLLEVKNGNKGIITLNRPKVLNSLNQSMIRKIFPKLKEWNETASCVIIKGTGGKAFCAGGDVVAVTDAGQRGEKAAACGFFSEEYNLDYLISNLKVPYVAILDGITMGGGVGLSVHGRYRIATEKTVFAMPETAIGFLPDVGGGYFLPRLPHKNLGYFLALSGYRLKGSDAYHAGIATHYCPSSKLAKLEEYLINTNSFDSASLENFLTNELKNRDPDGGFKEFSLAPHLDQIQEAFGSSHSVESSLQKLKGFGTEWSKKQVETIERMSPTALKVAYELLKRGGNMSLRDDLIMEFAVVSWFLEGKDFYEGVRALLKDKDNKPNWKPSSLQEVTPDIVNSYFVPLDSSKALKLPNM